jgi:hypothetical protein
LALRALSVPEGKNRHASWLPDIACKLACLCIAGLGLSGCSLRGAPSYSLFGAFFPAWLLCAAIGAVGSLGLRSFVIAVGLEDAVPFKLLVYVAFAVGLALWLWLSLFGER